MYSGYKLGDKWVTVGTRCSQFASCTYEKISTRWTSFQVPSCFKAPYCWVYDAQRSDSAGTNRNSAPVRDVFSCSVSCQQILEGWSLRYLSMRLVPTFSESFYIFFTAQFDYRDFLASLLLLNPFSDWSQRAQWIQKGFIKTRIHIVLQKSPLSKYASLLQSKLFCYN